MQIPPPLLQVRVRHKSVLFHFAASSRYTHCHTCKDVHIIAYLWELRRRLMQSNLLCSGNSPFAGQLSILYCVVQSHFTQFLSDCFTKWLPTNYLVVHQALPCVTLPCTVSRSSTHTVYFLNWFYDFASFLLLIVKFCVRSNCLRDVDWFLISDPLRCSKVSLTEKAIADWPVFYSSWWANCCFPICQIFRILINFLWKSEITHRYSLICCRLYKLLFNAAVSVSLWKISVCLFAEQSVASADWCCSICSERERPMWLWI